jgi:membrane protease YdiL (CAAX protease family)
MGSAIPDWLRNFKLDLFQIPYFIIGVLFIYSLLFFPSYPFLFSMNIEKATLHILISIWEEMLMRGLLLALLLRSYPKNAISVLILSGCLFGALHLLNLLNGTPLTEVLPQVVWSCALGIAFAILTYLSHSIVPAIVLHCWFNLIPALWEGKPWILTEADAHGLTGILIIAILFLPLILVSIKGMKTIT